MSLKMCVENSPGHPSVDGEPPKQGECVVPTDRVQPGGRLVEQQHARLVEQGLCKSDFLCHARRECSKPLVRDPAKLERFEQLHDPLFECRPAGAEHGTDVAQETARRHVFGQRIIARQITCQTTNREALCHNVVAKHGRAAPSRTQQAQEHADGCRLAGTIVPHEAEDFAVPNSEGHVIDCRRTAVGLGELEQLDRNNLARASGLANVANGIRGLLSIAVSGKSTARNLV